MLDNNFFTITDNKRRDDIDMFTIEINSEHKVFDGHFPNMAVMPGVCSLMVIKEIASKVTGKSLKFSQIKECKFLSVIMPKEDNILNVKFSISEIDGENYKINSLIEYKDEVVMKLKANLCLIVR